MRLESLRGLRVAAAAFTRDERLSGLPGTRGEAEGDVRPPPDAQTPAGRVRRVPGAHRRPGLLHQAGLPGDGVWVCGPGDPAWALAPR